MMDAELVSNGVNGLLENIKSMGLITGLLADFSNPYMAIKWTMLFFIAVCFVDIIKHITIMEG